MLSIIKYIYLSLKYYWKSHFAIILGASISTMVLTGTLFVGDSIKSSLERSAILRLGETDYVFSGIDRFFRASLANDLQSNVDTDIAPILLLNGIGSSNGGEFKLNGIQVVGIDERFGAFVPGSKSLNIPQSNECYISENLAQRLKLDTGAFLLLRIEKASQIPKNAPFISAENNYVSTRLKVAKILGADKLGRFNLKVSQTAPYNVFLSLSFLNDKIGLVDKANHVLISENDIANETTIINAIHENWILEDMALELFSINEDKDWELRSERVFMDSNIVNTVQKIDPSAKEILTYMANSISNGDKETPYSFVSAGPFMPNRQDNRGNQVVLNRWIAEDLGVAVGDSIRMSYYIIGPLRKLREENRWFQVSHIVEINGIYAEKSLMPNLPGLSDAGSCREWEAGVPVELNKIRDKDEDYWKKHRGTPKAFISYETGKELWENRFGIATAIRFSSDKVSMDKIRDQLPELLTPQDLGYSLKPVKKEGLNAARGGVDFSQLFMGLSFFLLLAGLILMALLFNLHLERRKSEIGTLKAVGYSYRLIRRIVLLEAIFLAIPGVIMGGILAILYNKLIFKALNTVWYDIVRTSILQEDIHIDTLLIGISISLIIILITMWYNVFRKLRSSVIELQRIKHNSSDKKNRFLQYICWISGIAVIGLVLYESLFGASINTGTFFLAGGLLLISLLSYTAYWFKVRKTGGSNPDTFKSLIEGNLIRNRARSLRIIILFSLGTFVIISTGLNRKDLHSIANIQSSGTGGFLFFMETTLPVLQDLNSMESQSTMGIDQPLSFVQLRKNEGDDASCLNLNKVNAPRILGIPSEKMTGRFSFIKSTADLDKNAPWLSLKEELDENVIPAFADQTVIQWGLGKEVGDTLIYLNEFGHEIKLKIIGGLANSIFQGNVLVDDKIFLKHFPSSSGSHVFLVDGDYQQKEAQAEVIERAFRNDGLEIEFTGDRLAKFNQVENTYLSIFMLLGGLAMILGTFGLGIVLVRNIMDRETEIGVLRAIGYRKKEILNIITLEHMVLLIIGTLTGACSAFLAIMPSLISEFVTPSWQTALVIIALILLNGYLWIYIITRGILKMNLYRSLRTE